jgi:carboxypeptidase Taq
MTDAYRQLEARFENLAALAHATGILGWDEQTMMPESAGDERNFAVAKLSALSHRILTETETGELIERAAGESLDEWQQSNVALMRREFLKASALPSEFVERQSRASMKSEQMWRKLRPANDWASFLPYFEENVALAREEAALRAAATGTAPYDALLDMYEPGLRQSDLDRWFAPLAAELPGLIDAAAATCDVRRIVRPEGPFPVAAQERLGRMAMETLRFDFTRGRLDVAVHPFCGGAPGDVRITTRYSEDDFQESLMGVIHESGHAQYEQNLPADWRHQPVGQSVGMAVHESQSLFFEMQIGRSAEFLSFLAPRLAEAFPHVDASVWELDNMVPLYQSVERGFIRVNADEITYPAHILMRYAMEKELIAGTLAARDVPDRWNAEMTHWLNLSTRGNDKDGCMQDVHWPSGLFGYFPTYTLGAMIAAQLAHAFKSSHPDWASEWRRGEFGVVRGWLHAQIWSRGSRLPMKELVVAATGRALDPSVYLAHLRGRYLD